MMSDSSLAALQADRLIAELQDYRTNADDVYIQISPTD